MHIIHGVQAASSFRLQKHLSNLQQIEPAITGLTGHYIHLVITNAELSETENHQLHQLLDVENSKPNECSENLMIVCPRPGTISPWSSKATDIVHNCGLNKVSRIERGIAWNIETAASKALEPSILNKIADVLHDRMTEAVFYSYPDLNELFISIDPKPLNTIPLMELGTKALERANSELGLALSTQEIDYLFNAYQELGRDPSDVELMMFAQANSEHCRHKIFNSAWTIDGEKQDSTLFGMIRETHRTNPGRVLSAYSDNAAVISGYDASRFFPDNDSQQYSYNDETVNVLMKVETHNHPTAISPLPGAATGSGGEIRDEAATGRGGKPKAGLTGFSVSNLNIPDFKQAWETDYGKPDRIVSALDIMIDGPIGGSAFNNEFGRPNLVGYFRSYEQYEEATERVRGYHKPIMIAGGYGSVRPDHVLKQRIPAEAKLIVLGGPAMLIGLGGGAASSMASGSSHEDLDFASVQRHNPEIQRRCQEVVDRCWALGENNPIISIHDVGAGGLSNALPELVSDCDRGAIFQLRKIPNDEPGMSPMEIWCNEAQERYVLAIAEESVELFEQLCQRERAPYAILGHATEQQQLVLNDELFNNKPIDMPLSVLLGKLPQMQRATEHSSNQHAAFNIKGIDINDAIERLLKLPTIADKRFLITIGDRSVSGLVCRDQMVGPWQIPVADCAVTASGYGYYVGEAMAMGERTPVALIDSAASARMALAESITNIAAARIMQLSDIALSANWMAACGQLDEDAKLYDAVQAVSQLCQQLGICIPVGKDSLSMNTVWQEQEKQVTSPLSLIITAFAPVVDTRQSLTPQLSSEEDNTLLLLIDLAQGKQRLGGSCFAQVFQQIGNDSPDLEDTTDLTDFFRTIQLLNETGLLLAYHDRSDGGLYTTLTEMCLASRQGMEIDITALGNAALPILFNEELGVVIQIREQSLDAVLETFNKTNNLGKHIHVIGKPTNSKQLIIRHNEQELTNHSLETLQGFWSATSYHIQSLRDNPDCAKQEYEAVCNMDDPGLFVEATFTDALLQKDTRTFKPKIAILREQGINGQTEMAAAFERAGFDAFDVHMTDIMQGKVSLNDYSGLAACGGFSYGDVLGAGGGWAKSILFDNRARDEFEAFFTRQDTFALGVCNGCQMLSQLKEIIPGTDSWPRFVRNQSEQFEARLVMVEITKSESILFDGMANSQLPIVVAHGEGRVENFDSKYSKNLSMRYISNNGDVTEHYPANPNGSKLGMTGFTSDDGRFNIMMPHPERVFLSSQFSWLAHSWRGMDGPWMAMFHNARKWLKS